MVNKSKKAKRIKSEKYVSDEMLEVRKFVITLVIVLILSVGVYFLSVKVVNKRNSNEVKQTDSSEKVEFNYEIVTVGTMFNRYDNEYYVAVYDFSSNESSKYSNLISVYNTQQDTIPMYLCDLSNPLNSSYLSGTKKGNSKAKNIDDVKFGDFTLIRIKNGVISNYVEGFDNIKEVLQK